MARSSNQVVEVLHFMGGEIRSRGGCSVHGGLPIPASAGQRRSTFFSASGPVFPLLSSVPHGEGSRHV